MLKAKIDRLARKIDFLQKKKQKKTAIFLCTNLGYLTLEGPELQAYPRKVVGLTVQTSYVEGWWYQN